MILDTFIKTNSRIIRKIKKKSSLAYHGVIDRIYLEKNLQGQTPVLIHQMGKVGSSSIYYSLKEKCSCAVFHAHKIAKDHYDFRIRRLYKYICEEKKPINIISLTREPIGRTISAFFQNFKHETGVHFVKSKLSLNEIKYIYLKSESSELTIDWFDQQIINNYNINVYDTPFTNGVGMYLNENIRLLVLCCEMDDALKEEAIRKFLVIPEFTLRKKINVSENKDYAQTYREFVSTVKFPEEYVKKMLDSKYFRHFYDNETWLSLYSKYVDR